MSEVSPEPRAVVVFRRLSAGLARLEEATLAVSLAALVLLGAYQAVKRNFFGATPFWIDEVIRWSVFYVGLCGGALAAHSDRMINIDMVTRLFSPRGKLVLRILCAAFTVYVCWIFFEASFVTRTIIESEHGEVIPPAIGWLALPAGMALIAAHTAIHAVIDAIYLALGRVPPEILEGAPKE